MYYCYCSCFMFFSLRMVRSALPHPVRYFVVLGCALDFHWYWLHPHTRPVIQGLCKNLEGTTKWSLHIIDFSNHYFQSALIWFWIFFIPTALITCINCSVPGMERGQSWPHDNIQLQLQLQTPDGRLILHWSFYGKHAHRDSLHGSNSQLPKY